MHRQSLIIDKSKTSITLPQNGCEDFGANPIEAHRTMFKDFKKKDCKTLFYIQQNVHSNHFEKISKITRLKEA